MVADVADEQAIPSGSIAMLCGWRRCARRRGRRRRRSRRFRCPASVEIDAGGGVDLAHHVVVALGDVEVAAAVEADLVRHVQRASGRRPAVAGVGPLTVAGDVDRAPCRQVEPPDPLVVEIAEVQRAVGADGDAVRIVHRAVRKSGRARADQRRDGWRREGAGGQERHEDAGERIAAGHRCRRVSGVSPALTIAASATGDVSIRMRAVAAFGSRADVVSTAAETVTFWISAGRGPTKTVPGTWHQLAHLLKADLRLATRDDGGHRLTGRRPSHLSCPAGDSGRRRPVSQTARWIDRCRCCCRNRRWTWRRATCA